MDNCSERVQTSDLLSATVLSCQESSSHRRNGRDTDKTVLSSCLAWRCELASRACRDIRMTSFGSPLAATRHGKLPPPLCISQPRRARTSLSVSNQARERDEMERRVDEGTAEGVGTQNGTATVASRTDTTLLLASRRLAVLPVWEMGAN